MPSESKKHLRKKVYVDRNLQGGIAMRAARYWVVSMAVVGMLTVVGWIFVAPGIPALIESPDKFQALISCLLVAMIAATALMPIVVIDLVKFSHRFAGPMVRLRSSMERAAAGEHVEPLRFRDGDYWQELADAFNELQARIERAEKGQAHTDA